MRLMTYEERKEVYAGMKQVLETMIDIEWEDELDPDCRSRLDDIDDDKRAWIELAREQMDEWVDLPLRLFGPGG